MNSKVLLFFKGCFMGICDLIPGISGGTIAFVSGIYPRLIASVKAISPYLTLVAVKRIFSSKSKNKQEFKTAFEKVNIQFLSILLAGIGFSLFSFSRLINFLLNNYLVYTLSFFTGLIFASSKLIFDDLERNKPYSFILGFLGLISGGALVILNHLNLEPNHLYVFFGGFCAVNAMFLPGISGAFILLVLGLYDFMIQVLLDPLGNLSFFFVFIFGALLGAFTISRIVTFFLRYQKTGTLCFLLGLVLGSLGVPIQKIIEAQPFWDLVSIILIFSFFISGSLVFFVFGLFCKKYNKVNI